MSPSACAAPSQTLGYSKDLRMHKLSVRLYSASTIWSHKHKGIDDQTPARAAGVEETRSHKLKRDRLGINIHRRLDTMLKPLKRLRRAGRCTSRWLQGKYAPVAPKLPWYLDFEGDGEPDGNEFP